MAVVYVSKLYTGSTSDLAIVEHSNMLSELKPGDMILADKGFTIQSLLPAGVHLNIPPFFKKTIDNTHPLKYRCAEKLPDHASMWRG